jgi:succinyl-CoA synthetase alpha subunit
MLCVLCFCGRRQMEILADEKTRVLVQGITGRHGTFHTEQMLAYGTRLVAGVSPGRGGLRHLGVPIFNNVRDAIDATGASASVVFVPPASAVSAILEAVESGIGLIVCITEGIPLHDMARVMETIRNRPVRLVGPNCPGILVPGKCKLGIIPGWITAPGPVGVLSRSGTLLYEAIHQLTESGVGQSTCIGLGGDPILGMRFADGLKLFAQDPETEAVLLIGEIGGTDEEDAADAIRNGFPKPVFAYVAGVTAPPETRMGHAGAFVSSGRGDAKSKIEALREAGVIVIDSPTEIGANVRKILKK